MPKILAIIAEYNPFHNGHKFHLDKSKLLTGADYVICITSGNFMQRGEPSIVDKFKRAEIALKNGIDLVVELPAIFATSNAEVFALGAMKIIKELRIVDYVSFGSECGDILKLNTLADLFNEEPSDFVELLKFELDRGISYPKAIENATNTYFNNKEMGDILSTPNNTLAIEYLKAIKKLNFEITPITVKREGLDDKDNISSGITSGSNIRKLVSENKKYNHTVPFETFEIIEEAKENNNIVIGLEAFEDILIYKIRELSAEVLKQYPDVTEGLENKIKESALISTNYEELVSNIKSKRYTEARIRRILTHILLDITNRDVEIALKTKPYIRVLGFTKKGRAILSAFKKSTIRRTCTSVKEFVEDNSRNSDLLNTFLKDIYATNIYNIAIDKKANTDYTNRLITP